MGVTSPSSRPDATTLVEAVQWWSDNEPDRPAFAFVADGHDESARFSYARLDREARRVAAALSGTARPGDRALLCFAPGPDFVVGYLGCLYAGVIAVPVNPPQNSRHLGRLTGIADDCGAVVVLGDAATLAALRADAPDPASVLRPTLTVDTSGPDRPDVDWRPGPVDPSGVAFLQYTSGSTAAPKGVVVAHDNLAANLRMLGDALDMSADTVVVSWLPTYHDMGLIGCTLTPLWHGHFTVQMPPMAFLRDPMAWLRTISRYRATVTSAPNFGYELAARTATPERLAELDLSTLETACNGAEPLRADTMDRFSRIFEPAGFRKPAFYPCYGLAEATLLVSGRHLTGPARRDTVTLDREGLQTGKVIPVDDDPHARPVVSCGPPQQPQAVAIVEPETGRECSPHEVGEIWLSGPHVARGYWNNPQATAEIFEAVLPGHDGTFLRTGDLGFLHEGELYVSGRQKDLVIVFGRNHYPQDIEATVARHHQIGPGGSVAFSLEHGGSEGVAIVAEVAPRHQREDLTAVAEAIARDVRLDHDVSVLQVVLVKRGALPKTSSGKVRRRHTRDLLLRAELTEILRWPDRTPSPDGATGPDGSDDARWERPAGTRPDRLPPGVDDVLDMIRSEIATALGLRVSAVDVAVPMGDLGLDSLGVTLLRTRLHEVTGVALRIETLRDQTCLDLAKTIFRTTLARAISQADTPEPQDDDSYDQGSL
ncbi:AMP-binding protein [Streptomyces sp. NPDC006012]|uniref:AMP-binding protein n=1 Tax=Streptomyces sp. NPDC006012 TaxID=3364739 RepID=UPI003684FF50